MNNLKNRQPDILVLDIKLPCLNGIQLSKIITKDYPNVKIVFLSSNTDEETINKAIKAEGVVFLLKDVTEEEFILALDKITNGENYYSTGIQQTLFNSFTKNVKIEAQHHDEVLSD